MLNLKNKAEREAFVSGYKSWGVFQRNEYLDWTHYLHTFANGGELLVTEYTEYVAYQKEYQTRHRYCLRIPATDGYITPQAGYENYHRTFTLDGCSLGTVVDYMTKNKDKL